MTLQFRVAKLNIGLLTLATVLLLHASAAAETVAASNRGKAMDAIVQKFESLAPLTLQERFAKTIQFANSLKEIRYAATTSDGNLGCIFKDSVPYVLQVPHVRNPAFGTSFHFGLEATRQRVAARNAEFDLTDLLPTVANTGVPELPSSNRAVLVSGSDASSKSLTNIEKLLSSHGYGTECVVSPTVNQIAGLGQAGIVYLDVQAAMCPSSDGIGCDEAPMFATGDDWSAENERAILARAKPGQIAWMDTCSPNAKRRVAMVSQRFLEQTWDTDATRLVVLVGQNSPKIADELSRGKLGRSTFCAFVSQSHEQVPSSVESFLARALGAGDPRETVANESPDRPFDVQQIADVMGHQYLWASLGGIDPRALGMPYISGDSRNAIQLAPSIKHAVPQGNSALVDIEGTFGADPGAANRSVTLKGATVVVKKWTPTKITIALPFDVAKSQGELKVISNGRPSNSRWLSSWTGEIMISITGEGTLNLNADFKFTLVGDPWTYREKPGGPVIPPIVFPLVNVIGTTCTWSATGEKHGDDGTVERKWQGGGTPEPWIDVPNALQVSRQGTFSVGAVGDAYNKLVNLNPGMLENMDFTEGGYTEHVPVKLGDFNQGQTIIQPRYDSAFKILARTETISDEEDKLSYGGLNGKIELTKDMVCNSPMPPNAPR